MNHKKIIELLKSGDFTVAYHDNDSPTLYTGKHKYWKLKEEDEIKIPYSDDGYLPAIVALLVEALGGESSSV